MSSGYGLVKQILTGDTILLTRISKELPLPEKQINLAFIQCPKVAIKTKQYEICDEKYGWEAREFLRQLLIGKSVKYVMESDDKGKNIAVVFLDDFNVNKLMLENGLAKLIQGQTLENSVYNEEFVQSQLAAKKKKLGIWNESNDYKQRNLKWLLGENELIQQFTDEFTKQNLEAVIEYVKDGSSFHVYFLDQEIIAPIKLSGITVDTYKRLENSNEFQAEPFAEECRTFSALKVLNQNVHIIIEGCDKFGWIYGTLLHPKGNLSLYLLNSGLARINERTIHYVNNPHEYREAQIEAKEKKLGKWKSMCTEKIDAFSTYNARVIEVHSADTIIVSPLSLHPNENNEIRLNLAFIKCPKPESPYNSGEPYWFEAKEFTRELLIGKNVKITHEYTKTPVAANENTTTNKPLQRTQEFVSINLLSDGSDIIEKILAVGYANLVPMKKDVSLPVHYDKLVSVHEESKKSGKGIFSRAEPSKQRFHDISTIKHVSYLKNMIDELKRSDKLEGIIEYIYSATKMRIRIPEKFLLGNFVLSGVFLAGSMKRNRNPVEEEQQLNREALKYTRQHFLQRKICVKVESNDKRGNILGLLFHGSKCVNVELVRKGYVNVMNMVSPSIRAKLYSAKTKAMEEKKGIWGLEATPSEETIEEPIKEKEYIVKIINPKTFNDFTAVVIDDSSYNNLHDEILNYVNCCIGTGEECRYNKKNLPLRKQFVLAQIESTGKWHRAKVESVNQTEMTAIVFLCDLGIVKTVCISKMLYIPKKLLLTSVPPLSFNCSLSGLKSSSIINESENEELDILTEIIEKKNFHCIVEKYIASQQRYLVILKFTDPHQFEDSNDGLMTVNEYLVNNGYALVNKRSDTQLYNQLISYQSYAKKNRLNIWRYGDIDDDSN